MDILEKIEKGDYTPTNRKPIEYDFTRFWAYKKGDILLKDASREEYNAWLNGANREPGVTVEKIVDKNAYKAAVTEYRKIQNDLRDQFRDDVMKDLELDHLCTKNAIFQHAWDESHDEGLAQVYYTLTDLTDLFEGLTNKKES